MADPALVLLILIAAREGEHTRGSVVGSGLREALGEDVRLLVEEREVPRSDADARELGERLHASAVAELAWSDRTRSRARLHVFVSADKTFYDRELTFAPGDDPGERERAVGFLLGAMVRAVEREQSEARTEERPLQDPERKRSEAPVAPTQAEAPGRLAIDLGVTSALSVSGAGTGAGPAAAAQVRASRFVSARVSGAARFGAIAAAEATITTLRFGAGAAASAVVPREGQPLSLQIGLEAIAVNLAVHRERPSATRDRWVPGIYATILAGFRLTARFEPYVGLSAEAIFGTTPIVVDERTLATIPVLRAGADAGVRLRF